MSADEKRIREFAYQIWESEGQPKGQDARHWEMARKLAEAEALAPNKSTARQSSKPKLPKVDGAAETKAAASKVKSATAKSAPKPASETAQAAAKPASKSAASKSKPAAQAEQPAKPASKPAAKPAVKTAAKPAAKKASKPSAP